MPSPWLSFLIIDACLAWFRLNLKTNRMKLMTSTQKRKMKWKRHLFSPRHWPQEYASFLSLDCLSRYGRLIVSWLCRFEKSSAPFVLPLFHQKLQKVWGLRKPQLQLSPQMKSKAGRWRPKGPKKGPVWKSLSLLGFLQESVNVVVTVLKTACGLPHKSFKLETSINTMRFSSLLDLSFIHI